MSNYNSLIDIYKRYGFALARQTGEVLVFTLKTGYFDNAEIIKINKDVNVDSLFGEFSNAGYACTIRDAKIPEITEEELFKGFFSVNSTKERLIDEYHRFTSSLVKAYGDKAKYEYINAPYNINGKTGEKTPPEEVLERIYEDKPILFLVEAAAGFGKTCTAQEIAKFISEKTNFLPLYAELSRNRQARIFRYILLDEIDRTFPLLSSKLVQTEIKKGRISVILDGFDELLRKGEEGDDFDNKEPMLETISELLREKAKVIITTRRTVLFDGDEFHQWLDSHSTDFSIVRIRIQEPKISDWLPYERMESLSHIGIDIRAMANPVLLSYMRCIDEESFQIALNYPEKIVQSYFEYMLDRERERQDLRMTVESQEDILQKIADDMICKEYTSEDREYIVKTILEKCSKEIENARSNYTSADRPSRDEIANKLASHALLDRSISNSNKIGFVNEFSLGNYVAKNIILSEEWLVDDLRFIEPAVKSYMPRTELTREILYNALGPSLPFLTCRDRIGISADLTHALPNSLNNAAAEDLQLNNIDIGAPPIASFQFTDTIFKRCRFVKSGLNGVTFLNCKFFDCEVEGDSFSGHVYILGGISAPEIGHLLTNVPSKENSEINEYTDQDKVLKRSILKRFWPIGESTRYKPSRPIYKLTKHLITPVDDYTELDVYNCIQTLIKENFLIEKPRTDLITLNIEYIDEIQGILDAAQ